MSQTHCNPPLKEDLYPPPIKDSCLYSNLSLFYSNLFSFNSFQILNYYNKLKFQNITKFLIIIHFYILFIFIYDFFIK